MGLLLKKFVQYEITGYGFDLYCEYHVSSIVVIYPGDEWSIFQEKICLLLVWTILFYNYLPPEHQKEDNYYGSI